LITDPEERARQSRRRRGTGNVEEARARQCRRRRGTENARRRGLDSFGRGEGQDT